MTHKEKRIIFTRNIAELILYAHSIGFMVAETYCMRCRDCPVGKKNSAHKECLAVDLDLYINGRYKTKTNDHAPLGKWWREHGGKWGGDFNDGNHYEFGEDME